MSLTARRQIRLAALAALQVIQGLEIESPGAWDVAPTKMPALRVRTQSDSKRGLGKAPPIFTTTVDIELQLYIAVSPQEECQDMAEAFGGLIEDAVLSNPGLIKLINRFVSATSDIVIDTKGKTPIAKVDLTLTVETVETFVPTGPLVTLSQLWIYFDAVNVADPTGTYSPLAFPNSVTPAPRLVGPDGRNEGLLAYDMTTGQILQPIAPRPVVRGKQVYFPDGTTLEQKRGWNWGRVGFAVEQDADDAVAQGATIIRIPLRWWGYYQNDQSESRDTTAYGTAFIDPAQLVRLDQQVQWCVDRRLWYIIFIDSDCGQNGLQNEEEEDYCAIGFGSPADWPDGNNFLTNQPQFQAYRAVWRFIAARYANTPYWAIAELTPEIGWATGTPDDLKAYYATLAGDVRQSAPGVPFMVGGFAYKITAPKDAWDPTAVDYIYTGDLFLRPAATPDPITDLNHRLSFLVQLRTAKVVPIFVQQSGVNSGDDLPGNVYLSAMHDAFLANSIGWTTWLYRDGNTSDAYGAIWTDNAGVDHRKEDVIACLASKFIAPTIPLVN